MIFPRFPSCQGQTAAPFNIQPAPVCDDFGKLRTVKDGAGVS